MTNTKHTLRIATCQFPVSADIRKNSAYVRKMILRSKRQKADIVHFSEASLSGYAGTNFKSWKKYDWGLLHNEIKKVMRLAGKLKLWVILAGNHRLTGSHKPHNCLYVINPKGKIIDRYDKCFCTSSDLKFYTPGDHLVTFTVNGIKCGLLICFDVRFPEIYRRYKKLGAQVIFHPFYVSKKSRKARDVRKSVIPATLQGHAGSNYLWISANNVAGSCQTFPGIFITPDGWIAGRLKSCTTGLMVNTVDTGRKFYDAVGDPLRNEAIRGKLHSGNLVSDSRSKNRKILQNSSDSVMQ